MSATYLRCIHETTTAIFATLRNSHGTHRPLWDYLGARYLGCSALMDSFIKSDLDMQSLWDLVGNPRVEDNLRLALGFTFDWAVCPFARKDELAAACSYAYECIEAQPEFVNMINHWQTIATHIQSLIIYGREPEFLGMTCTSVGDAWEEPSQNWQLFNIFDPLEKNT